MDQDFYRGFSDASGLAYFDAADAWGDMYSRLRMDSHQVRIAELGCYDEGLIWGAKWKDAADIAHASDCAIWVNEDCNCETAKPAR